MVKLKSIYDGDEDKNYSDLYKMLIERESNESISHNTVPTWNEHVKFINTRPYKLWCVIKEDTRTVGSIYLTYQNEIGIHIFKFYRRNGFAQLAINLLMDSTKERFYLANINPANEKSISLFTEKFKFSHIQNTYRLERYPDAVS